MDVNHENETAVPQWARPLGFQGYRAFIALVESYFNTRNIEIDIDSNQGVVKPELDSTALSSVFGLQNIAQVCRQADRDEWRSLIEAHFDSIFTVHGQDNALEIDTADFAQIERSLRARLYPSEVTSHTSEIVQRPGPEGTLEVLALDLPTSVRTVSCAEAERWGLSTDELFAIGRRNLRQAGLLSTTVVPLDQGTSLTLLSGDPFYAASHLLILDDYLGAEPDHGMLVGIPKRDVLILHEIHNVGAMEAITAMLQVIVEMHHDGPGSLSPYLYWYHDGEFTVLPYESEDDALTFVPPDEFVDVMDELMEIAELS